MLASGTQAHSMCTAAQSRSCSDFMADSTVFWMPRTILASAMIPSHSMGLRLWGIVLEPTLPRT